GAAGTERSVLDDVRRLPRHPLALYAAQHILQHAVAPVRKNHAGAQSSLEGGAWQVWPGSARGERGDVEAVAHGAIPVRGISRGLKWNAAAGEILREPAPGSEVQLLGALELREVTLQARPLGQQAED